MIIKIYYDDGTIEDYQSTYLSFQDGFLVANDSINLAIDYITEHGITLSRNHYVQDIEVNIEATTPNGDESPLNAPYELYNGNCLIAPPENVDRILRLTVDGETVLQRFTDGILRNVMLDNLLEDYK